MSVTQLLETAQFLVDAKGNKKGVVLDVAAWEELLTLLEDLEDSEEIRSLRGSKEKAISWGDAKTDLRSQGIDV
jgi:hypothetical protein